MRKTELLLISGGLDSVVLAYKLHSEGKDIRALYFDLGGERTLPELGAAKHVARSLQVPIEVADLSKLKDLYTGYVPGGIIAMDGGDSVDPLPPWKTPSGATIMLSISTYYAHVAESAAINTAYIAPQMKAIPELQNFLSGFSAAESKLNQGFDEVPIHTPFIGMDKAEVIALGSKLGAPLDRSWSCARRADIHCGKCNRCVERIEGFSKAGIADPTQYAR